MNAKTSFIVLLALYGIAGLINPHAFWLIDGANLIFHESGHPVFSLFGHFMGMFGGTLMQLLVPGAIAIAFLFKNDLFSANVMLFWFGENFIHISTYVKDARAQQLQLIGGGVHDWHYLLGTVDLLERDIEVSALLWTVGLFVMAAAVYYGFRAGFHRSESGSSAAKD